MAWFKRKKRGIYTETKDKKNLPEGLWHKCPNCKHIILMEEHKKLFYVCSKCSFHDRISSNEYFNFLFDKGVYTEIFSNIESIDSLQFEDTKKYDQRLKEAKIKSGVNEAISVGVGKIMNKSILIACMNFNFIGGSIGAAVGEKISKSIDHCIRKKIPLIFSECLNF